MDETRSSLAHTERDAGNQDRGIGGDGAGGFGHVLVVVDDSPDGVVAASYGAAVVRQFGGIAATVEVSEEKARRRHGSRTGIARSGQRATSCAVTGPTEGSRNRALAQQIADAAGEFGADVIVLGLARTRLARHRVAPSLRSLVAQATEVPVLLAPPARGAAHAASLSHAFPVRDPQGAEGTGTRQRGRYAGV